jgi:hypothetical protein
MNIEMVAALDAGFPVMQAVLLGEYPLPGPIPFSIRILASQCVGHLYTAPANRL